MSQNVRICLNTITMPACTITDLSVQITTQATSGHVRFGIWAADAVGKPGNKVFDSGTVDASTTGWKTVTPGTALVLAEGIYWIGIAVSDAAIRYGGWECAFPAKFGGPEVSHNKMRTAAGAWTPGNPLPTTVTPGRTNNSNNVAPVIYARVSL